MTNAPQDVDDTARRDRLDVAMSTRAARWCGEIVARCLHQDAEAGRDAEPPALVARDYTGMAEGKLGR